ncbi:hypothetical protein BXY66_3815 [Shimia isoporae]|uniref:Uncharacterized protein n=1 Tax=Shimia isoporae TaxID=647720 RepID=A0A4R1N4V2_9RHOB|nr:hypothetical protein [Shimia isoporae]TCK99313.1 hypothetical protein BXY66_3815 [Shimia isoporae]
MRAFKNLTLAILAIAAGSAARAEQGDMGFSNSQTERTVSTFLSGIEGCAEAPPVYRVDCFQQAYAGTVRVISNASAYWEAEVALTRINRNLYSFVRANTDKSLGRERYNFRVRAVTEAALPEAQALYAQSVDQAVAIMRGGNSAEVKYFKPLADAVEASRDGLQ